MPKPIIKKDCKGEITAASVAPEYQGRPTITKRICKEKPLKNIYETLKDRPEFSSLVKAIDNAGVGDILANEEYKLTLFAPTNEAVLAGNPRIDGEEFTPAELADIIAYHLLTEPLSYDELDTETLYQTVNPLTYDIDFEMEDDKKVLMFNEDEKAYFVTTDIKATNGFIHAIDRVLYPRPLTIGDIVEIRDDLSTLRQALEKAGLLDNLKQEGNFTLLAPDNKAFDKINLEDLEALLNNPEALSNTLLYHLTVDFDADDVVNGQKLKTNQGGKILVTVTTNQEGDRVVKVDDAVIVEQDIQASNGRIQIINSVLNPNRNDIQAGETKELDVDKDGDADIKIKRINNTQSYIIEILTKPIERYACARISRDGKDDGALHITNLPNGEVRIDVNGDVYICSVIPNVCDEPVVPEPTPDEPADTVGGNDTVPADTTPGAEEPEFGTPVPPTDTVPEDTITPPTPTPPAEPEDTITPLPPTPAPPVEPEDEVLTPPPTLPGEPTPCICPPPPPPCEEVVVALNYRETVATLKGLLQNVTFMTEADFKAEVNKGKLVWQLPKGGELATPDRISAIAEKNSSWAQVTSIINSLPFTIWRIPAPRNKRYNVEYLITLLHEEGVIQIRIPAVET
jgi:uncharacterized surface protein with fasciclin (FAS1) repeats